MSYVTVIHFVVTLNTLYSANFCWIPNTEKFLVLTCSVGMNGAAVNNGYRGGTLMLQRFDKSNGTISISYRMHEIWPICSQENHWNYCHKTSKKGRRLGRPSEFAPPPKKILATPLFTYLLNQCFTGNTLSRVVFTKFITISNSEHDKGNSASDEQRFGSSRPVNCSILCRAVRTTLCRNESYKHEVALLIIASILRRQRQRRSRVDIWVDTLWPIHRNRT